MKIQNPFHHRNYFNSRPDGGFSLVELLVVMSIVAILSVSSVIGFGYLGNTLKAREVAGFISDVVKQEELKVLRGDFDKAVVHILSDYLVIEEWQADATDALSLLNDKDCESNNYKIAYSATGTLTQKDGDGNVIQVKPVIGTPEAPTKECVLFKSSKSKDLEWDFQLSDGDQLSATLRFLHFNLQRDSDQGGLSILSNAGSSIEIRAPYGRKSYFKEGGVSSDSLTIDVGDSNARESITFQ